MRKPKTPKYNLVGSRFGELSVIKYAGVKGRDAFWHCICSCGNLHEVRTCKLTGGHTKSCGCRKGGYRHGQYKTSEYHAYAHAKQRCVNPDNLRYDCYGGRGIEFKFISFEQWYAELGPRPSSSHSVDRPDNDGHYELGNVRWATISEQARNKRNPKLKTHCKNGHEFTLENTKVTPRQRVCLACRKKYLTEY